MVILRKLGLIFVVMFFFAFSLVLAYNENINTEARTLIDNKIACSDLSSVQLETLGEYYMELMNPGEAHVYMDSMMGGEGSESLKLAHVSIGRAFYCGDYSAMGPWMMYGDFRNISQEDFRTANMGRGDGPWMMYGSGGEIMGSSGSFSGYGAMGEYGYGMMFIGWVVVLLILAVLVLLVIWLIKQVRGERLKVKRK